MVDTDTDMDTADSRAYSMAHKRKVHSRERTLGHSKAGSMVYMGHSMVCNKAYNKLVGNKTFLFCILLQNFEI